MQSDNLTFRQRAALTFMERFIKTYDEQGLKNDDCLQEEIEKAGSVEKHFAARAVAFADALQEEIAKRDVEVGEGFVKATKEKFEKSFGHKTVVPTASKELQPWDLKIGDRVLISRRVGWLGWPTRLDSLIGEPATVVQVLDKALPPLASVKIEDMVWTLPVASLKLLDPPPTPDQES